MSWEQSASCAQSDPDLFFPEPGEEGFQQTRQAIEICRRCPVEYECWWDQITSTEEPYGVRAGQRPAELKASMRAFRLGGDQRAGAEVRVAREQAAQKKAAEERARRAEYLAGREDRQREASRKYAAAKRARLGTTVTWAEEQQTPWEVPEQRQPERAGDVAEVA